MKASNYIAEFFAQRGVTHIFGYIGGMITHLVDSIDQNAKVSFIQTYHEQTASIAAEGYALETGLFGVAICTSGPGVTNMMTGIADAYFGSIPVIYISGQVNSYEYKYDKPIRQQGFQEMEVVNVVKPITKYAVLLDNPEKIRYELEKAVYLATTGRKGPVVIDLPMDVSRAEIDPEKLLPFVPDREKSSVFSKSENLSEVFDLLRNAERPMMLIGGGCTGARNLIESFLKKTKMPVVTSLMGRGLYNEEYSNHVGMLGSYGNRCANMAVSQADLLVVLGSRLDTRQTGARFQGFLANRKIIHVDIDENELICHRLKNRVQVHMTVQDFLEMLLKKELAYKNYNQWNAWIQSVKTTYSQDNEIARFVENKSPYLFFQELNKAMCENDIVCVDVGQNQMWAAQTLKLKKNQRFSRSGGLAPMGYALPAAIGFAFANPQKKVYCIVGDGGFHMSVQSMLLISQYRLNITVVVLNNSSLGMITQFQHLYFNDRMAGTTPQGGYFVPDLKKMAESYAFPYYQMSADSLDNTVLCRSGFSLVDYRIENLTTVSPKLEYNQPIERPSPQIPDQELEECFMRLANGINRA